MKIDEAERKGDSFHQQVCQMKLRDKSRGGRSLGLCTGLTACSLCQLSQAGLPDKWLQLRPAAAGSPPPPTAVRMTCQSSPPPEGLLWPSLRPVPLLWSPLQSHWPLPQQPLLTLPSPAEGQACGEHFSALLTYPPHPTSLKPGGEAEVRARESVVEDTRRDGPGF